MSANLLFRAGQRLAACRRGAIAVEMGFIAPVIVAIALGLFEYAGMIEQSMRLTNAARVGVEYAARYPSDSTGIKEAVTGSGDIEPSDLTIGVGQFCECPDGTPVDCAETCPGGIQNDMFMRVTLSQPARAFLTTTGLLSGHVVNASATLRVR